jgi:hypothetical protein
MKKMSLLIIQTDFEYFIKNPNTNPIWKYDNIEVYISSNFIHSYTKQYNKISKEIEQLWKCFRNVSYGLDKRKVFSKAGNDGIFLISTNSKKYDNKMVKTIKNYYGDWNNNTFVKEFDFLERKKAIPVRVVAHPNRLRIRPIGFIVNCENIQKLVLTDIIVEKI